MSRGFALFLAAGWVLIVAGARAEAGSGGPDGGGYSWIDSDEASGAMPAFDDISGSGWQVTGPGYDNRVVTVAMGMTFPFYGVDRASVSISTNGNVHFDAPSTAWSNRELPDSARPNAMIAPFWDDLATGTGRVLCRLIDGPPRRFVVQWDRVEHADDPGVAMTFQVRLYESGLIAFEYADLPAGGLFTPGDSASIGIENDAGTAGLTLWRNGAGVFRPRSGSCVHFYLGSAPDLPTNPGMTFERPMITPIGVGFSGGRIRLISEVRDPDPGQPVGHEVEVLPEDAAFDPVRVTGATSRSSLVAGGGLVESWIDLGGSGAYRWRVRAVDAFERPSAWLEPADNRFEADVDAPAAPRPVAPCGGSDLATAWPDGGAITLRAEAPADPGPAPLADWDFQVSSDPWFGSVEAEVAGLPGPEATLDLKPGRRMRYWRARVWDAAGQPGVWSGPAAFRVVADDGVRHAAGDARRVCGFGAAGTPGPGLLAALAGLALVGIGGRRSRTIGGR